MWKLTQNESGAFCGWRLNASQTKFWQERHLGKALARFWSNTHNTPTLLLVNMDNLPGQGVHWISSRDEERPIALGDSGPEALPAETVMEVFTRNAQNFPNKNAMNATVDGVQKTWTWKQYYDDVITAGRAMMALGVEEMDAVSIIGFNSPGMSL